MLWAVLDVGSPFSGRVSGVCAVLGPLLLAAGELVGVVAGEDAAFAHVLSLAGAAAFVPAVVAMGGVLRGPERGWGTVGTVLALLGCLALACGAAVALAGGGADPGLPVSLAFYLVGPTLLYIGLLVLVLGLVRNGVAGFSGPGLAALGLLVVGVGRFVGGEPLTLLGHAVLLVGLAAVGRAMMRWG